MDETYMTPAQVAALYGVCKETVYRWIKRGKLPCVRIERRIYIRREDLPKAAEACGEVR